jgi:AcrR family transcriptional regulator
VSIQQITDAADVGFGSFYNHFDSKVELFAAAMEQVLEEHGQLLDAATAPLTDPAEVLALSVRATGRIAVVRPDSARILLRGGTALLTADHGLAPRALRDLRRGMEQGRFSQADPRTVLALLGGGLLGVLQTWLSSDGELSATDLVTAVDELVELVLRALGLAPDEAHELSHRPLPHLDAPEPVPSVGERRTDGVR